MEREREREGVNWLKIGVKWGFIVFFLVKFISKTPSSVKRRGKRKEKKEKEKKVFGTLDPRLQDQV